MWHAVNEVRESYQGGGEADNWTIECRDEDLGVRVESLRNVEVISYEGPQLMAVRIFAFWNTMGRCHICSAKRGFRRVFGTGVLCLRREESTYIDTQFGLS